MNLSKNCKFSSAITPTAGAAGATDINGATLDMEGFDGVLIIVRFGAITTGAATSIKVQQDSDSGMGTAADLAGSGQTIADTDDDKTFYIDVYRPTKRYLRLVTKRATQNAVVASAEYIQYNGRLAPTTHGSNVSGESHYSPDEGTA